MSSELARPRAAWLLPTCLLVLYTVWGSTYLAQHVAMTSFAPLQMAALRFVIAGTLLYAFARARGAAAPSPAEWRAAVVSALPLMVTGMGLAAIAIRRVPSGLAALVFGSVPLWVALFDRIFGGRLGKLERAGLVVGFAGVAIVSTRGGLRADPVGALLLVAAAASYGLGCVATRRANIPRGLAGTATQMLAGGAMLTASSFALGERWTTPTPRAATALAYLVVAGSLVAYSAFGWLMKNARPSLATSYAYVNPVVALALGATLGGESIAASDFAGLGLVLAAVSLVTLGARAQARSASPLRNRPGMRAAA